MRRRRGRPGHVTERYLAGTGRVGPLTTIADVSRTRPTSPADTQYREVLRVPWWWYLVGIGVAAILAGEFRIAGIGLTAWVPFCVLMPIAAVIVWSLGRSRVEVGGGELRVRDAHIPLTDVSGAVALDRATLRRVVGREGDPAAFVAVRPWVGTAVQLWLDDPDDPTPYWVISTRRPSQLLTALRAGARPPDGGRSGP